MRTLLHAFPTFDLGGAQARFVQLAQAFGPRYRHLIVSMDGRAGAGERLGPGVDWQLMRVDVQGGGGLSNRGAFRRALQAWRPDAVLSYNWGAIEWAAGNLPRLVPHVHVEDGFGPGEAERQFARRVWTRRLLLGRAFGVGLGHATVVVPSQRLAAHAAGWWVPEQRLRWIPNGVKVAAAARARPVPPADRALVIGTVAVLRPEKNLQRLLRAFAAARRGQALGLLIVGDGPERAGLQALAQQLGVAADVEFAGYQRDPAPFLQRMDLFALSSDTEQQPMSLLEAMALGLPIVSTRVGDVARIVPAEAAAALCAPDDADFARTLQGALAERAQWPARAEAGLRRVRDHFAFEAMVERWRRVFDGEPDLPAAAPASNVGLAG